VGQRRSICMHLADYFDGNSRLKNSVVKSLLGSESVKLYVVQPPTGKKCEQFPDREVDPQPLLFQADAAEREREESRSASATVKDRAGGALLKSLLSF
jgi:hypothetical protein